MTATTVINPLQPIALLDVENILDNEYFKWCADETQAPDGRWLRDDELTYNNFEITPNTVLSAGTTVKMPYLWGWSTSDITNPVDYVMTPPFVVTAAQAVHIILSVYHNELEAAGGSGRFFFIEEVRVGSDGKVQISWGT